MMERWSGKVAFVTGASVGIGAAISKELTKLGLNVVGFARRVEEIEALASQLENAPGKLYPVKGDITKEEDILSAFEWVKNNLGGVDVLVNNAGIATVTGLTDGKTEDWNQIFDINVIGLSICTREALKSMKDRGVHDGHIIHINSIAGHYGSRFPGLDMYAASKQALRALTEGLRRELVQLKSQIKITSISPGPVDTDMFYSASGTAPGDRPILNAQDIANAVIYTLSTPPHVQVHEIMVRPVGD